MVRDARGSAAAVLTWVLGKGRNRLQNLEATRRTFSGPTSFQIFGKHLEERLRTGSKYLELWTFLKKIGSFKTALTWRLHAYIGVVRKVQKRIFTVTQTAP